MNRSISAAAILALASFVRLGLSTAQAQAPANDNFATPTPLSGPRVTATGSNVGATKDFRNEPFIAGNFGGATVWWTWLAPASGEAVIDTEGSDFNTLLGVFTGEASNRLTPVAQNNDFEANTWSRVTFNAVGGTLYRIMVDGAAPGTFPPQPARGNITLNVKGPGGVLIEGITNGMQFTVGDPIPFSAIITTNFPNPPATRVDFFRNGALVGSRETPPFEFVATNTPAGSNSFTVLAIDSAGATNAAPVITVVVLNVGVTLLAPVDGSVFTGTNPIPLVAGVALRSGVMTNVEFLVDGVKFAEASAPPFVGSWASLTGGSHRLTAVGHDDAGTRYKSAPVNIAVSSTILPRGSVWKYLDNGSDQGTQWQAPSFDDSTWASGPAELGYGDGDEATVVGFGPDTSNKYVTTYFRRSFVVTNLAGYAALRINVKRDDGAVLYLNGAEAARFNMGTGAVSYATLAPNADDDGAGFLPGVLPLNLLVEGTNYLAVEMHQTTTNSSDISFEMDVIGVPIIIRNLFPEISLVTPTNGALFLAPLTIPLEATAADADGSVIRVDFRVDGLPVGEDQAAPYAAVWTAPVLGPHRVEAVATDDLGGSTTAAADIVVYDAAGTPFGRVTEPLGGHVAEGPTNMLVTAFASATDRVAEVEFRANGTPFATSSAAPYSARWVAPFGRSELTVVVRGADGRLGTSAVNVVTITIPPTNVIAPTVGSLSPAAFATISNLTNITVSFTEWVQGVDASDLLINGVVATRVSRSSLSNYTFFFPQPPYGEVEVAFATGHGITDYGFPSTLPFNELSPEGRWEYLLVDRTAPVIARHVPATGATVTKLAEIEVGFSEAVTGVDGSDLLVNGVPALDVRGSGSNYLFNLSQPPSGTIAISWATNHGIADISDVPNAFNPGGPGATWSFTLDARTVLIQSNATWRFVRGTNEASFPLESWRLLSFKDTAWTNSPAPFFYGDPYTNATITGTVLSDMQSNYSSIFLRHDFVVADPSAVTEMRINAQADDGYIAWINGVEVARFNMAEGDIPYTGVALTAAPEAQAGGANYTVRILSNALPALVSGTNILAVQVFNQSLTTSSDFGFNAQLYAFITDPGTTSPRVALANPPPGDLLAFTNVTIFFSEAVTNVDAADLLINGVPPTGFTNESSSVYTFQFAQPAYGPVLLTWAAVTGILDFDDIPKPFNGAATNSILRYTLFDPAIPRVASQTPAAGAILTNLTSVSVRFTESVTGVTTNDLLINGLPATRLTGSLANWRFLFPPPPYGPVKITWATNHGIRDLDLPPKDFDPAHFGGEWSYTLIDPVPSVILTSPTNGLVLQEPATVTLRATAKDNDGTISDVRFLEGSTILADVTSAPFTFTISNVLAGPHTYRAVAYDNIGLNRSSATATILVVTSVPVALVRGPYLQSGSPTGAVVRWRTDLATDVLLKYGADPAALTNAVLLSLGTNEHIARLTGLEPETRYYYSIGTPGQPLVGGSNYWFKTSPPAGLHRPTRIWALGDSGTANENAKNVRNSFNRFAATNGAADFWLMLGDNAYNRGLDSEYQAAVFDLYPETLRNLFLWPALGNHESDQSFSATSFPYLDIFSPPEHGEAGGVASGNRKYYSFNYGDIHFICLDSMTSGRGTNSVMVQWLIDDLAAATATWNVVFFHHPPYTHGSHNSDVEAELIEVRQNILPILEANGVDLVLSGHSHCLERSYLLNGHYGVSASMTNAMKIDGGSGREEASGAYRKNPLGQGTVYTVAGSSGQISGGQLNHAAHFISLNELGSLVIDVSSNRMDVRFLGTNVAVLDHFTLLKREDPAPAAPSSLLAQAAGPAAVALAWTDAATNETSFLIERSLDGTNFVQVIDTAADVTSAVDSDLVANTTYYYRVRASNLGGESDFSNIASATPVNSATGPRAPSDLVARADNGLEFYRSQMFLRWRDRSDNESGFLIERSTDGATFAAVGTVGANVTVYLDRNLSSATAYFYRVRGFNSAGTSAPSLPAGDETHPQGDLVEAGQSVTFHAGVEGAAPVRYQWRFLDFAISGETNEWLTLANVQFPDEGSYSVVITDAAGRTVSNPAWLYVIAPPFLVEQPAGFTGLFGTVASLRVVADALLPLSYQWRKNGVPLPGADQPRLPFGSLSLADQGDYDVLVSNSIGSVTSRVARLVVNRPPVAAPDLAWHYKDEGTAIELAGLLANDSDADGDPIALASLATNTVRGGTLVVSGRYVRYTPPAGLAADDSFTYAITDGRGGAAAGAVTVSLTDNQPPALSGLPDFQASVLTPLVFTNQATDPNLPTNRLTFALAEAPATARINPTTGVVRWVPSREEAPGTNVFLIRVKDDGTPSLSDTRSCTVVVNDFVEATAGSALVRLAEAGSVPVDFFSTAPLGSVQCLLHYDGNFLANVAVEALAPTVASVTLDRVDADSARLTFLAQAGRTLQGTQQLARLHFTAVPVHASTIVPLQVRFLAGQRALATGGGSGGSAGQFLPPTPLANDGRIIVLGEQPLIEGRLVRSGSQTRREISVYGLPNRSFTLQSSTQPDDEEAWQDWRSGTLSPRGDWQTTISEAASTPQLFYRTKN